MNVTHEHIARLREPFRWSELEQRQQGKPSAKGNIQVLTYVQRKAIIDRLDAVVGPENWQDEYTVWTGDNSAKCRLSIRIGDFWVCREDAAEQTDIEAVKGGVTGAFKRAASKWGIGLYLYDLPTVWLPGKKSGDKVYPPDDMSEQVLNIVRRQAPHLLHPADSGEQRKPQAPQAPPAEQKSLLVPLEPEFRPPWIDDELDAGRFAGARWHWFLEESDSGGRISYLEHHINERSTWALKAAQCYLYRCTKRWFAEKLRDGRPLIALDIIKLCAEKGLKP